MLPAFLVLLAIGCGGTPPSDVTVEPRQNLLDAVGSTVQLSVSGSDPYGQPVPVDGVVWTSSDPSVATVDAQGKVTAVGTGRTNIQAAIGDVHDLAVVDVAKVGGGTISGVPSFLKVGDTAALKFDVVDDQGKTWPGDYTPACASDKTDVADVKDGTLTAAGPGHAKLTCKFGDKDVTEDVRVVAPDQLALAATSADAQSDYDYVRSGLDNVPQVKAAGADKVKISKFTVTGGKRRFAYVFCGLPTKLDATMEDAQKNEVPLHVTGPCAKAFPADAPPWVGAPWIDALLAAHEQGVTTSEKTQISVDASQPDTWTMTGASKPVTVTVAAATSAPPAP